MQLLVWGWAAPSSGAPRQNCLMVQAWWGCCMAYGCVTHISQGKQVEKTSRKLEKFMKHIFFVLSKTANCLSVSSLHQWTIKHAADQKLFSGTCTLVSYKYYSRREQNKYCLLMFPLEMVINASWHDKIVRRNCCNEKSPKVGFRLVFISRSILSSLLEEQGTSYSALWRIY